MLSDCNDGPTQASQALLLHAVGVVIDQRDGAEQHRHGRRGQHGIGDRIFVDVRAEKIELLLDEGEGHAVVEIAGVENHIGQFALR